MTTWSFISKLRPLVALYRALGRLSGTVAHVRTFCNDPGTTLAQYHC